MAKPSEELNKKRGERVKELLILWNQDHPDEKKKTQAKLAEDIGMNPIILNDKIRGRRTLTEDDARKIANILGYRFEYIMCFDDYRYNSEQFFLAMQKAEHEAEYLHAGLVCFASLSGYQVTIPSREELSNRNIEEILAKIRTGFTIEKDGSKISLSIDEMNRFENHLCDVIENELKFLFYMKGEGKNG